MGMKPEVALPISIGLGGLILAIHRGAVPTITDVRSTVPGTAPHNDVDRARRQATWFSVAIVSGISLVTKDVRIFIIGGLFAVGFDVWERIANETHPSTGLVLTRSDSAVGIAKGAGPGGQNVRLSGAPFSAAQASVM